MQRNNVLHCLFLLHCVPWLPVFVNVRLARIEHSMGESGGDGYPARILRYTGYTYIGCVYLVVFRCSMNNSHQGKFLGFGGTHTLLKIVLLWLCSFRKCTLTRGLVKKSPKIDSVSVRYKIGAPHA